MKRRVHRVAVALLTIITLGAATAAAQTSPTPGDALFRVVVGATQVGTEQVTLAQTPDGWAISSTGRQIAPVDLVITKYEVKYAADWQPRSLSIEATAQGRLLTLDTTFAATSATNTMMQGGQTRTTTQIVSPRTVVLPNGFFAGYEGLAIRLATLHAGDTLQVDDAPQTELTVAIDRITPTHLSTPEGPVDLREFDLTFKYPAGPVQKHVWIDQHMRLARLEIPSASLTVVRDDLGSVMTRFEVVRNAGDQTVLIPSNGFNLAGTVTLPQNSKGPWPAVVLIGGSGPTDRDEIAYDIPIFGQIAGRLADAGFLVVRYDKRGVGQSGGRTEIATLDDYAEDARAVVKWVHDRRDVDHKRIAVVGHSEGGAVAMILASRDDDIAAVALVAAPGHTGKDLTLLQQRHELAKTQETDAEKQAKVALEQRLIDAAVTGVGWDAIPAALRSVDTPWFKSWLLFDPAKLIPKIQEPILILQGSLDTQVPPEEADRLETLGLARGKLPATATKKVIVPGVNHLLVPAKTGEIEEYPVLAVKTVSPDITSALAAWLGEVLHYTVAR